MMKVGVLVRVEAKPGMAGELEKGKIVEYWDVIQPVRHTAENENEMF